VWLFYEDAEESVKLHAWQMKSDNIVLQLVYTYATNLVYFLLEETLQLRRWYGQSFDT
jgi:hypothetical protein